MKKVVFSFMFLLLFVGRSYAESTWITVGYSYFLPQENTSEVVAPIGPINFTIGGQITDWIAMDFSIGYLWNYRPKDATYATEVSEDSDSDTITTTYHYTDINMMPIRLDLLFQPVIDTGMFDILPYIGIGPQISISNTDFKNHLFSYGFSAKAGIRFTESWLMIGLGIEYLFNTPIETMYQGRKISYDGSGIMFGGEIGISF